MTLQSDPGIVVPAATPSESTPAQLGSEWWRTAVIYQIYPRSFADSSGDGIGDLQGITARMDSLVELGIDAIWLSPFYSSPQKDAGYDVSDYCDVDPLFGSLDDFDRMLDAAHSRGIRLIVDLVPNHSSDQHPWFQAALAAGEGSEERARYIFRDGRGENGELPPNNWQSVFGGPAWTRISNPDGSLGQWYLHLFDSSQPDFDWDNRWVRDQFIDVLRFWLDRGVDGFRVDVAHGLIKADGLPDYTPAEDGGSMGGGSATLEPGISAEPQDDPPYWAQEGVHEVYREWRKVLDSYPGERILAAEAWVDPLPKVAKWVRPDEMHQAFNFAYLETPWDAVQLRAVIDNSLEAFSEVGAPSTWVLSNHDVVRHATRLSLTGDNLQGHGVGPNTQGKPDPVAGLRRARAASAMMLALPGSSYIYQGEELGLPEAMELPDDARQDPTWFRTNGERYGRDGCRAPIPWESGQPAFGFSTAGKSWLPQPAEWAAYARDSQRGVAGSTLELYRLALALRAEHKLGAGQLEWLDGYGEDVVAYRNGSVLVIANTGTGSVTLPAGREVLLASEAMPSSELGPDTTVWLRA